MEGALSRLQLYASNEHAQYIGRQVIAELLQMQLLQAQTVFLRANGSAILTTFPLRPNSLAIALKTCIQLLQDKTLRAQVVDAPTMHNVIQHLQAQPSPEILHLLFLVIGGSASSDDETIQEAWIQHGVLTPLMQHLTRHEDRAKIQQWGFWCLFNLSHAHRAIKAELIQKHDVCKVVLQGMAQHPRHAETQRFGALVLNNCLIQMPPSFQQNACKLIQMHGLVPIIQSMVMEFPEDVQLKQMGQLLLAFARSANEQLEQLD